METLINLNERITQSLLARSRGRAKATNVASDYRAAARRGDFTRRLALLLVQD
jgi:hypothetical protein